MRWRRLVTSSLLSSCKPHIKMKSIVCVRERQWIWLDGHLMESVMEPEWEGDGGSYEMEMTSRDVLAISWRNQRWLGWCKSYGICRSQPRSLQRWWIIRLGRSQASINLNRLETHGMTLPLSLIESKVLFGTIESLRFSDLMISESHQNQSKPRFGDLVCRWLWYEV